MSVSRQKKINKYNIFKFKFQRDKIKILFENINEKLKYFLESIVLWEEKGGVREKERR